MTKIYISVINRKSKEEKTRKYCKQWWQHWNDNIIYQFRSQSPEKFLTFFFIFSYSYDPIVVCRCKIWKEEGGGEGGG